MGCKFGLGNWAFQFGRQTARANSRDILLCPPLPVCFACPVSHSLFLASKFLTAKVTTAKRLGTNPPPPCTPLTLCRGAGAIPQDASWCALKQGLDSDPPCHGGLWHTWQTFRPSRGVLPLTL